LVGGELLDGRTRQLDEALEADAVHVEDGLHQLAGALAGLGVGALLDLADELADPVHHALELGRLHVRLAAAAVAAAGTGARRSGSLSSDARVKLRSARTVRPYMRTAAVDIFAPGGSSMNGMNLSGKPGMVQPMQMPPTLGQPPTPSIQPRLGTLQLTTGPQQ